MCRKGELLQATWKEVDFEAATWTVPAERMKARRCLLYTSDAADERSSVDLGGRRIIKKKKEETKRTLSYS